MSTFWTPNGERPIGQPQENENEQTSTSVSGSASRTSNSASGSESGSGFDQLAGDGSEDAGRTPAGFGEPSREEVEAQMEQLRQQLAETPAAVVVANHCFGLFELAALHLATSPAKLSEAQLAIDAMGAIVESLTGRLGDAEPQLVEGLTQLRMAFVQIRQGVQSQS